VADAAKPVGEDTPSADGIIHQLATLDAIQLERVITAAEKQRTAKLQEARDALIARVREEAGALGFDPAELFARPAPAPAQSKKAARGGMRKAHSPAPDKYRSPDGQHAWSGRGKTPAWLAELEASGRKREEFRIPDPQSDLIEQANKEHGEAA
jgi:DNA-binding protein H-NS